MQNDKRKCDQVTLASIKQKQMKLNDFCISKLEQKVSQNKVDKLITEFIIDGLHPLSTVEETKFIALVKGNF